MSGASLAGSCNTLGWAGLPTAHKVLINGTFLFLSLTAILYSIGLTVEATCSIRLCGMATE